jgi:hypothetical protein
VPGFRTARTEDDCSRAAAIPVKIIAGPLYYLGVNPKISWHRLPEPGR